MNSNVQYFLSKYGMDEYKNCKNITEIQQLIYAWCKIEPNKALNNKNISENSLQLFMTMAMKNCYQEIDMLNR